MNKIGQTQYHVEILRTQIMSSKSHTTIVQWNANDQKKRGKLAELRAFNDFDIVILHETLCKQIANLSRSNGYNFKAALDID